MATITFDAVTKWYTINEPVVHEMDLEIRDKEFLVIVGPSGCGKSTTLRMIAGLEDISSGVLRIDGKVVNDVAPKDRDIAMVFQNYALYPHMTVQQNMAFGLKLRKTPKAEIQVRVDEAARILGLGDYLNRKPRELSGGQRQRVAVGRAIVRKPKVFLFDEPLSNLDAKMRVQTRGEIARLHRDLQATIVYVTHDQVEAMTLGTRIVVMDSGHIMQVDTPLQLYHRPANRFVASFIGSPAMNLIPGTLEKLSESVFRSSKGNLTCIPDASVFNNITEQNDVETVEMGVRPEHWLVSPVEKQDMIPIRVDVVEPLGSETYFFADIDDITVCIRTDGNLIPKVDETWWVRPAVRSIHLFRKLDGIRL